jgi:hypothetical protein
MPLVQYFYLPEYSMARRGNYLVGRKRVYPYDGRILTILLYADGLKEKGIKRDEEGRLWVQIDMLGTRTSRTLLDVRSAIDRLAAGGFIYELVKHTARYYCLRLRTPEEYRIYKESLVDESPASSELEAKMLNTTERSVHGQDV